MNTLLQCRFAPTPDTLYTGGAMCKTTIIERHGILLHVQCDIAPDGVVSFLDIRVLNLEYQPCGPNLVPLLDPMLVLQDDTAQPGSTPLAERLLSTFLPEVM